MNPLKEPAKSTVADMDRLGYGETEQNLTLQETFKTKQKNKTNPHCEVERVILEVDSLEYGNVPFGSIHPCEFGCWPIYEANWRLNDWEYSEPDSPNVISDSKGRYLDKWRSSKRLMYVQMYNTSD